MSELTTKERYRESAKETANFFFIMANIGVLWEICDAIWNNLFNFEMGIFTVLVILVDFCIQTGLIDIISMFEDFIRY